jgi:DNA repair exonuclease SbcCD ATPase subunit
MPAKEVLTKKVAYSGEGISVKSLESSLSGEREKQNVELGKLQQLKQRNEDISKSLGEEIKRLRKFSDFFKRGKVKGTFFANMKEMLSYIPLLSRLFISKRSIEELLKQQYEISSQRVKEAANYADRLKASEQDLFKEIERLDNKVIEHARNSDIAADAVLELKAYLDEKQAEMDAMQDKGSVAYRELQAEHNKARQLLSEHSTNLELYSSAEERLARLKENTRRLQETITNLYTDISRYVRAASEKLDDAIAQIQAIGTAADASVVLLDMKRSLDVMTASMNETTRFVSETQMYLRENLDSLIKDLEVYDEQTQQVLDANLERSRKIEDAYVQKALDKAMKIKQDRQSVPA